MIEGFAVSYDQEFQDCWGCQAVPGVGQQTNGVYAVIANLVPLVVLFLL